MHVKKVVKNKDGVVKFEGELSEAEHDFVVSVGLATLMQQGAIPFTNADETDVPPLSGETH